jgi:hypothetical protein
MRASRSGTKAAIGSLCAPGNAIGGIPQLEQRNLARRVTQINVPYRSTYWPDPDSRQVQGSFTPIL